MKNVYIVTLKIEVPVVAESELEAVDVAIANAGNEVVIQGKPFGKTDVRRLRKPADIPAGWQSTVPHGDEHNRTLAELLARKP